MKVSVDRESESEAVLTVELEWSELEKAADQAYRRLVQRYNVPGFRRGKAPRSMLERMLGREALYQEGLESLILQSYREAVRTHNLTPVGEPTIETTELKMDHPYTFTARVPVLAPVKLGDYKGMRVEPPRVEVTDEDVERVLRDLQQRQALWVPVERPAQVGDKVAVDLKLEATGRSISDLEDNEFELVEGREGIFSGMDEHVVGMSEGQTREFTTTIPQDYANAELAGQEAHYSVTLKGVKFHELPAIDDELAKSASDHQTLDQLRDAVRKELLTRRRTTARRDFREQLLTAITDQAEVEIHPVLVHEEAHVMLREMERLLEQSGLSKDQFLAGVRKDEEEYVKELEPDARARVKRDLVLDAIADAEGITIGDEEIRRWLDGARGLGVKLPGFRELTPAQRQHIVNTIRRDRVTRQLVESAGGEPEDAEEQEADTADEATVQAGAVTAAAAGAEASAARPPVDAAAAAQPATAEPPGEAPDQGDGPGAPPSATPNGKRAAAGPAIAAGGEAPAAPAAGSPRGGDGEPTGAANAPGSAEGGA